MRPPSVKSLPFNRHWQLKGSAPETLAGSQMLVPISTFREVISSATAGSGSTVRIAAWLLVWPAAFAATKV